jgi:hypothetical protein
MQIIAVTLYLQIQYPLILEKFLANFNIVIFTFFKNLNPIFPYTFSPSKFIFYHIDTNIFRNQIIVLLLFIIIFCTFITIIIINTYKPDKFVSAVKIIRYRYLNDLFGICITPLFLFCCHISKASVGNIIVSVIIALIGIGYVCWISYKIVKIKKLD